jgi:hypothetical protein
MDRQTDKQATGHQKSSHELLAQAGSKGIENIEFSQTINSKTILSKFLNILLFHLRQVLSTIAFSSLIEVIVQS